jgi:Flp pilus assembly secretin CpaC
MINTFPKQGYTNVVFNATFYRNGKKLNAIEQAEVTNFSQLVRSYDKSENPDKVKVEFKDQSKGALIWAKTFEVNELDEEIQRTTSNFSGLGEAEVNDLVQRKFAELERQKAIEQLQTELQVQKELNAELQFQVSDLQTTLDAKKQVEYYSSIIGMALPGLAKFFTGTPVAEAMNFLAGQEEDKELLEEGSTSSPDQRQSIIKLIGEFSGTLSNQELGTLYLLFIEFEKDKSNIQRILRFITDPAQTQQTTHAE